MAMSLAAERLRRAAAMTNAVGRNTAMLSEAADSLRQAEPWKKRMQLFSPENIAQTQAEGRWLEALASAVDRWLDPAAPTSAKVYAEREVMLLLRTGEPEPSETTRT